MSAQSEDDFFIEQLVTFAERAKVERNPRDLARLASVYRATIGAPASWGIQDRRLVGVRVAEALLPDMKVATGEARVKLETLLSVLLAVECEEPLFRKLSWDVITRRAINRWEAFHVLAVLAAQVGAFGGQRDVEAQLDRQKKAKNKAPLNSRRRAKRTVRAKG
jgi:hypothetical protein